MGNEMKKYVFSAGFEAAVPFYTPRLRRLYPGSRISWYVPGTCRPDTPSGLVIFLHGGDRNSPVDQPWRTYLNPQGSLRAWAETCPYLIVAPSAPAAPDGKRWNHPGAARYLLDVLEEAVRRFPVDRDRVILMGYSMGGFGAYHQSQLLAERLAGAMLGAGGWWETDFRNLTGLPVFLLHGRRDSAPEFKGTLPEARHHDWCGFAFAEAAARLMERYHLAHETWFHEQGHRLLDDGPQRGLTRFGDWMLTLRRDPDPAEVYLSTPAGSGDPLQEDHHRKFWLEIVEASTGDLRFDRIVLHGPNVARNEAEFQRQSWSLKSVRRSGCSAHGWRLISGGYRIRTRNVSVLRIWLRGKLPQMLRISWNGVRCEAPVISCVRTVDPEIRYRGYAEFTPDRPPASAR